MKSKKKIKQCADCGNLLAGYMFESCGRIDGLTGFPVQTTCLSERHSKHVGSCGKSGKFWVKADPPNKKKPNA